MMKGKGEFWNNNVGMIGRTSTNDLGEGGMGLGSAPGKILDFSVILALLCFHVHVHGMFILLLKIND